MGTGRVPAWVWMVLVVAHALTLGWALQTGRWDFPDSGRYLQAADNLKFHGELYARPWPVNLPQGQAVQEFTIRPLGYPLVMLGLGGFVGRPWLLLALQNLLSLLNIGLLLSWWTRWSRPSTSSWTGAVLGILTFPAQIIYANAVMSEILLQTVVVGMMMASLAFIETRRKIYFVGVAGALALAMLIKPVFYPIIVVFGGLGVLLAWRLRRLDLAVIAVFPIIVAGLYMGWNEQRTGYFHFSSIAEINLLHYNAAGVIRETAGPVAEEQWVAAVLHEANGQPDFAARQHVIQARAGAVLGAHPIVYARQHAQGMIALFLDPGRFDISQFLGLEPLVGGGLLAQVRAGGVLAALSRLPVRLLGFLTFLLVANGARLVLAGIGFWRLRNSTPTLRYGRWVAAGLLIYVALLTGPLGAARFLVPVWPILFGLALVGLSGPQSVPLVAEQTAPVRENQGQS